MCYLRMSTLWGSWLMLKKLHMDVTSGVAAIKWVAFTARATLHLPAAWLGVLGSLVTS